MVNVPQDHEHMSRECNYRVDVWIMLEPAAHIVIVGHASPRRHHERTPSDSQVPVGRKRDILSRVEAYCWAVQHTSTQERPA